MTRYVKSFRSQLVKTLTCIYVRIQENGLSKLDLELARCRRLLEVEHRNDHDAGYTYIDKTPGGKGDSFPLTPFMMKEWSRAIVRILFPFT
jgi:hypothetical protein